MNETMWEKVCTMFRSNGINCLFRMTCSCRFNDKCVVVEKSLKKLTVRPFYMSISIDNIPSGDRDHFMK